MYWQQRPQHAAFSIPAMAEGGDVIELTFYNADGQEDPWTDPVAEAITAATGVKLKTDYPVSSDDQKIALMIAEQNFPDMIYAKGDAQSLIDAGALIDLTDLIEEYGPNIKKMYGEEFDKLKYSVDDPSIYQLFLLCDRRNRIQERGYRSCSGMCSLRMTIRSRRRWMSLRRC